MLTFIKLIIGVIVWVAIDFACKNIPFEQYEEHLERKLEPYDYFNIYATIWVVGMFLLLIVFSAF